MKLSPGDQIQILLTVGGVPYAKTKVIDAEYMSKQLYENVTDGQFEKDFRAATAASRMMFDIINDIDLYGDEHEESRQEG